MAKARKIARYGAEALLVLIPLAVVIYFWPSRMPSMRF
jgi:hypothetical protein